jgi:hypothetical protein
MSTITIPVEVAQRVVDSAKYDPELDELDHAAIEAVEAAIHAARLGAKVVIES